MEAVIVYDSVTGNTRAAASLIADALNRAGIDTTVFPVTAYNPESIAKADLVLVGSWTDGLIVAGQRPGRRKRFTKLPDLTGKRAAVFCTYAVNPGKTLDKLTKVVAELGADVVGGMALHRNKLEEQADELVERLTGALAR